MKKKRMEKNESIEGVVNVSSITGKKLIQIFIFFEAIMQSPIRDPSYYNCSEEGLLEKFRITL